ncbi:CGNR zinc finger domain-containing protein [Paraburkholderia hospita]|uniref:CGNR zinc finger domain-containing protein n=1 Tax=Paraburkholderia hospita TaxID=169430 RepID=UPI000318E7E5|nr:CGNR zinc finger domain-containing protein [Paraburkholderia hospita]
MLQNRTNRADLFNSTRYGSKRWCDMTKSGTIARVAAIRVLEAAGKRERKIKRQK